MAPMRATDATTKEAIKVRIFVFIDIPFRIGVGPLLAVSVGIPEAQKSAKSSER